MSVSFKTESGLKNAYNNMILLLLMKNTALTQSSKFVRG